MFTEGHIRDMLQKEGHKTYFINNLINYIENIRNVYHLWQVQVLQKRRFSSLANATIGFLSARGSH